MSNPFAKNDAPAAEAKAEPKKDAPVTSGDNGFGGGGDPFASSTGVSDEFITNFIDNTLLVKPTEYIPEMNTSQGKTDAVRVDIAVLDDAEEPGRILRGVLLFQLALKREARARLEADDNARYPYLLGKLNKGKAANGNTLYTFLKMTDEDKVLAQQFLAARGQTAL